MGKKGDIIFTNARDSTTERKGQSVNEVFRLKRNLEEKEGGASQNKHLQYYHYNFVSKNRLNLIDET